MGKIIRIVTLMAVLFSVSALPAPVDAAAQGKIVGLVRIDSDINPGVAEYLDRAIKTAGEKQYEALVVELDTPGGLADSMREMVKDIMDSAVPIIVYVAPSGARAASAGVFITMSAHVAAMAPGTNIGAASPVSIGIGGGEDDTMKHKIMNDMVAFARSIADKRGRNANWAEKAVTEAVSITDMEAVLKNVVDLRAESLTDLLEKIDGRKVTVAGKEVILATAHAKVEEVEEQFRERLLRTLANPNIAYLLMLIGLAGLYFEFSTPGAIVPGAVGALSLILAFYAFNTLPVNYAGVLLILLGVGMFIAEIKVASYGFLTIGGIISLVLGSVIMFRNEGGYAVRVSWMVIIPTVAAVTLFFTVVVALVVKSQVRRSVAGSEGLVGERGKVLKEITDEGGKVFVHGEIWNAFSDQSVEEGALVEVEEFNNLRVKVKRVAPPRP